MDTNRAWANLNSAQDMLAQGGGRAGIITPKTAAAATKPSTSATSGPRSTTQLRNLAEAAEKTGVGTGVRTDLPWWQKLTGGAALALPGLLMNSEKGARYLAEGLSPQSRALAEQLGILTRAAAPTPVRAKRRKELKK